MKIKIKRCQDSRFWYNKHIGEILQVIRIDTDRYWCRELDPWGCINFVLIEDCEVYIEN